MLQLRVIESPESNSRSTVKCAALASCFTAVREIFGTVEEGKV